MNNEEYFGLPHEMDDRLIKEIRNNHVIYCPVDCNCAWLATDKNGYLGMFLNLTWGPIPISALTKDVLPVTQVEDYLRIQCKQLPAVSAVKFSGGIFNPYDWEIASRGIFIYDFIAADDRYELASYPVSPLTNQSLGGELLKLAEAVVINSSLFTSKEKFSPQDFFECFEP